MNGTLNVHDRNTKMKLEHRGIPDQKSVLRGAGAQIAAVPLPRSRAAGPRKLSDKAGTE
jgi:hypothetical protein